MKMYIAKLKSVRPAQWQPQWQM